MASKKLEELIEMTEQLPPFALVIEKTVIGETQTFKMEKGTGIQIGMFNIKNIAIARDFFSKGSLCPVHSHIEREMIIVYEGSLEVRYIDGTTVVLNKYDHVVISPQVGHCGFALEDTWFLAITLPSSEDWPNAG